MPITPQQLFNYAKTPNLELRQVTQQHGQNQVQRIDTSLGTLGGRIARHHKINRGEEDRTQKQLEYRGAKQSVQDALIEIYGRDIGLKAFRANIGHMRGEQHVSSSNQPITGRHIQKMIQTAESLIKSDVQRIDKKTFHTQQHHLPVTERGIAGWMQGWNPRYQDVPLGHRINNVTSEPNHKYKFDDTIIDVRAQHVSRHKGSEEVRRELTTNVARDLREDVNRYFQDNPTQRDGFWTLDLDLPRNVKGGHQHCIGIRMVRDGQPGSDMVHVFDANNREIKIPKDEFGGWLAMHLKDNYGEVGTIDLYRAQQTLDGMPFFVRNDGKWDCDRDLDFEQEFRELLKSGVEVENDNGVQKVQPQRGAYPLFWKDLTRGMGVHVDQDDETPLRLKPDNAIREMTKLVKLDEDSPELDAKAVQALSSLMNQSVGNSLARTVSKSIGGLIIAPTGQVRYDSRITRVGDKLRIEYTQEMPCQHLSTAMEQHQLSPETDCIKAKFTIEVSIVELRLAGQEGRVPNFKMVGETTAKLHIEGFPGPMPNWEDTKAGNAKTVDGIAGAIELGSGLIDEEDWAKFEQSMKDRVRDEPLIKFKDDGLNTTAHFIDLAQQPLDLRINGQPIRVGRPDRAQELLRDKIGHEIVRNVQLNPPNQLENELPQDPQLGEQIGLTDGQTAQLTRLLDRYVIDDFCNLGARSLGATPREISHGLKTGQYGIDIVRRGQGEDEYLDITLSQRVSTGSFLGNSNDDPLRMTMRIKVKLSDLTNGTPENFEIMERPKLELASPRDVINQHHNVGSWMLRDNPNYQPPNELPQLQEIEDRPHQLSLGDDMIIDLHGEHVRSMPLHSSLIGQNGFPNSVGLDVHQAVTDQINRYFQQNPNEEDCHLTLELNLTESAFGSRSHTLGIHAKKGDNDEIVWFEIFDPNRNTLEGDQRLYQPFEFEGALARHIDDNYGHVERVDLYRTRLEPRLMNVFSRNEDGAYALDRTFDLPEDHPRFQKFDRDLRGQAGKDIENLRWDKPPEYNENNEVVNGAIQLPHQFFLDLQRESFIVLGEQRERVTMDRAGEQLTSFVKVEGDDNPEGDKEAAKALSVLFAQTIGNALTDVVTQTVQTTGGGPFVPSPDTKSMRMQREFEVVREGDDVVITHRQREPKWLWSSLDGTYRLNPDTDYHEVSVTMRVSIEELRQAGVEGRAPQITYDQRPIGRIHIENFQPDPNRMGQRIEGRRDQTLDQAIGLGTDLIDDDRWNGFVDQMRHRVEREQSTMRVERDGVEMTRNYFNLFPRTQLQQDEGKLTIFVNGEQQPVDWQHPGNGPNPPLMMVTDNLDQAMQLSKLIDHSIIQDIGFEAGLALGAQPGAQHRYQHDRFRVELTRVDQDVDEPYIDVKLSQGMRLDQNSPGDRIIQRGENGAPPLPTNVTTTLRVKVSDLQNGTPQNFEVVEKPKLEIAPFPNLGGNQGDVDDINPNINQDGLGDGNNQVNVGGDVDQGNVNPNDLILQLDPDDPNNQQRVVILNQ